MKYVISLDQVNLSMVQEVGGKNAATGEMIQQLSKEDILVPSGFATTVFAYKNFLQENKLDEKIKLILKKTNYENTRSVQKSSHLIKKLILAAPFSDEFIQSVKAAYKKLGAKKVAVRSSATAEDTEGASFAGAQDTYLNIEGESNVLIAIKKVYASLFNTRAISYRYNQLFNPDFIAMSVGIQPMIRSDQSVSGVMFTVDTESGFDKVILINAAYGLGEGVVQGQVNPDEFIVYKPSLAKKHKAILSRQLGQKQVKFVYGNSQKKSTKIVAVKKADQERFCLSDDEIEFLASLAVKIEKYFGKPMDIEWAKNGPKGKFYILQARPETVTSTYQDHVIEHIELLEKSSVMIQGQSIGQGVGAGKTCVAASITSKALHSIKKGDVLVTDMTDPDWEPIMKKASAIVTNKGGRTCHAAIIARELGIPAIVGCKNATSIIRSNKEVTVSCAEGHTGYVYEGLLPVRKQKIVIKDMAELSCKLCINLGNPEKAFNTQHLPNHGVGLARLEFIISNLIGIHPGAALNFKKLPKKLQKKISQITSGYKNPVEYYVEKMREGIAIISAAFFPKQVIFRFSDFKSNEYANLVGGTLFEPQEENPMIGFRGASRYYHEDFIKCFELECEAFKRVREENGLVNAQVMIPFVRTVAELQKVLKIMERCGLKREEKGLKVYMMCEIPSNILLAEHFLEHVDGYSIGSNDLTQLTLGLDRDSHLIAGIGNERDAAVKMFLEQIIKVCRKKGKYIGICGQAPSDYPEFAHWLMGLDIDSMSLSADSIVNTWMRLAEPVNE